MRWGRRDGREQRVLGQIRAGGRAVMCIGGGGRRGVVVGQGAEDEVCLVDGVAGGVRGVGVPGVGVGVGVRLGMRQYERRLGARDAGPSDRVYGLRVVQGELRARGWLGVRRKGRRAAHHYVAVATRQPMLGELGKMGQLLGVGGTKRRTTG